MLPDLGRNTAPVHGKLLIVVGPSGVGKDSLISRARQDLSDDTSVLFVRRVITRATAMATEDHDYLPPDEFVIARASGQFAVHWNAHGLSYGIPATVRSHLRGGGVAVVNGSRGALPDFHAAFARIKIVHITAPPEILAARLAGRGRESETDISRRLQRAKIDLSCYEDWVEIDNSGPLESAAATFLETIRRTLREVHGSPESVEHTGN